MKNIKPVGDAPPCTNDTALETYFNSQATKQAIHVDLDIDWTLCNEELGYQTQTDDVSKYILHALDTVRQIPRKKILTPQFRSPIPESCFLPVMLIWPVISLVVKILLKLSDCQ